MSILAISVSHRSTSMARLAALAMDPATAGKLAQSLVGTEHIDEAVVLSTCNRTELWVSVSRFHGGLDEAVLALSDLAGEPVEDLRAMARVFFDEGAVAHLVIGTHTAREQDLSDTVERLAATPAVRRVVSVLRVEGD